MEQELIFSPQGLARVESGMTAARTVRRPFYIHFRRWLSGISVGKAGAGEEIQGRGRRRGGPLYKGEEMTAQS